MKKTKKILFFILILVLIGIFCFSAYQVIRYVADGMTQQSRYGELAAMVQDSLTAPTEENADGEDDQQTQEEGGILREYLTIYALNPDTVGWLKIEGTVIDYPVMQTPQDSDYYLRRNFDGEYNTHGCLYADGSCDVVTPSDNVTIYGHNMHDGTMFADLAEYLSESFWQEHRYIQFDTLTEHHTYEIFAVFRTSGTDGQGLAYHKFVNAASQADFEDFIGDIQELALYDTGITPAYGDKIICLSTCEYTISNGRLVVAAVRVDV